MTTAEFTRACLAACALLIGVWLVTFILSLIFRRNPYSMLNYSFDERLRDALVDALTAFGVTFMLIVGYGALRGLGLAG